MDLGCTFKDPVMQEIWDDFYSYYDAVGKNGFLIRYLNFWFKVQGIVSPRQIIAWRKLIRIMGKSVFEKVDIALNHNKEDKNIFFIKKYKEHFPDSNNLKITLICGHFWRYVNLKLSRRRIEMKKFFADTTLDGNCKAKIYTEDETLKEEFLSPPVDPESDTGEPVHRKPDRRKLCVKKRPYRMDIHSTIIEPKGRKNRNKTLIFVELPHTERTERRLEACFTIGDLISYGCKKKNINKLLRFLKSQQRPHLLTKSFPSRINLALNWEALWP